MLNNMVNVGSVKVNGKAITLQSISLSNHSSASQFQGV
jgi:hypothetical protein